MSKTKLVNIGKTLLGIPFAFVIWFLVSAVTHAGLYILDKADPYGGLRGDQWILQITRLWLTPGIGSYVAIKAVNKYIPRANLIWVLIGLCLPIIIVFLVLTSNDLSLGGQINNWAVAITTTIGAIIAYKTCDNNY